MEAGHRISALTSFSRSHSPCNRLAPETSVELGSDDCGTRLHITATTVAALLKTLSHRTACLWTLLPAVTLIVVYQRVWIVMTRIAPTLLYHICQITIATMAGTIVCTPCLANFETVPLHLINLYYTFLIKFLCFCDDVCSL